LTPGARAYLHGTVARGNPEGYLADRIEHLQRYAAGNTLLVRELLRPDSAVHERYLRCAQVQTGNRQARSREELPLASALISYLKAAQSTEAGHLVQELVGLSRLFKLLGFKVTPILAGNSSFHFQIPTALLDPGRRGALGAVLDLLRNAAFELRPEILIPASRRIKNRSFASAV